MTLFYTSISSRLASTAQFPNTTSKNVSEIVPIIAYALMLSDEEWYFFLFQGQPIIPDLLSDICFEFSGNILQLLCSPSWIFFFPIVPSCQPLIPLGDFHFKITLFLKFFLYYLTALLYYFSTTIATTIATTNNNNIVTKIVMAN